MENKLIPTESSQQGLQVSLTTIIVNMKKYTMIIGEGLV